MNVAVNSFMHIWNSFFFLFPTPKILVLLIDILKKKKEINLPVLYFWAQMEECVFEIEVLL